jgi:methylated-DNA-[protein]-cysteine S-methyltransferase
MTHLADHTIHFADTFATPFGLFSTAVDGQGALVATAFGTQEDLRRRFAGGRFTNDRFASRLVREQVLAYCSGERREFTLPIAPRGTTFQKDVWSALLRVPFGETRTYGQLAAELGNPAASRAVGRANATNPICPIVPCHRVIGADGSLTGFAFGEEIKRRLLEHERTVAIRNLAA